MLMYDIVYIRATPFTFTYKSRTRWSISVRQ